MRDARLLMLPDQAQRHQHLGENKIRSSPLSEALPYRSWKAVDGEDAGLREISGMSGVYGLQYGNWIALV
jgi:hypothetical protein